MLSFQDFSHLSQFTPRSYKSDINNFREINEIIDIDISINYLDDMIEEYKNKLTNGKLSLQYIPKKYLSSELCYIAVQENYSEFEYIPTEYMTDEIINYIILNEPEILIEHIFKHCELKTKNKYHSQSECNLIKHIILCFIKYDIKYFYNKKIPRTYESCLYVLSIDGLKLKDIEIKQTEEMCIEAVKQNGFALSYVEIEQTEKMCIEAVKQNAFALRYCLNQTDSLCEFTLKINKKAIRCINNKLFDKQIEKSPNDIKFIDLPSYKNCYDAVRRSGMLLKYCIYKTPLIVNIAIKNNPNAIKYINDFSQISFDTVLISVIHNINNKDYLDDSGTNYKKQNFKREKKMMECIVAKDPTKLQFINYSYIDYNMCYIALQKDIAIIDFIKKNIDNKLYDYNIKSQITNMYFEYIESSMKNILPYMNTNEFFTPIVSNYIFYSGNYFK